MPLSSKRFVLLEVLDAEEKRPLQRISISLQSIPRSFDSKFWTGFTDQKGEVRVPVLSKLMDLYVTDPKGDFGFIHKEVRWDERTKSRTLFLSPLNSRVQVLVTASDGQPVAGVPVLEEHTGKTVKTDLEGKCLFRKLPSGHNAARVTILEGAWRKGIYSLPQEKSHSFFLNPRSLSRHHFVVGKRTGKLELLVGLKSLISKSERKVFVSLRSYFDRSFLVPEQAVRFDGKPNSFEGLFPGDYDVVIRQTPGVHLWFGLNPLNSVVKVKEGKTTLVKLFPIEGHRSLSGFAVDDLGNPIKGLPVSAIRLLGKPGKETLFEHSATLSNVYTDETGHFELKYLPPGRYRVTPYPKLMKGGNYVGYQGNLVVRAPSSQLLFSIQRAWMVSGRVRFRGKAVCGGRVRLKSSKGGRDLVVSLRSNKRGECGFFEFRHVDSGSYQLFFSSGSGAKIVPQKISLDPRARTRKFWLDWALVRK